MVKRVINFVQCNGIILNIRRSIRHAKKKRSIPEILAKSINICPEVLSVGPCMKIDIDI